MRVVQFLNRALCLIAVVALLSGCSLCKRRMSSMGDNIGGAEGEGVLKDVRYAFDSSELDATARALLQKNAAWLKENGDAKVEIEGHCDERGTNEYNMALGMRRAKSAQDYLRTLGIDAKRMGVVSYGEDNPLDPGHNEVAWAKNRRSHFRMLNQ